MSLSDPQVSHFIVCSVSGWRKNTKIHSKTILSIELVFDVVFINTCIIFFVYSVDQDPSWKTDSRSPDHDISFIFLKPEFPYPNLRKTPSVSCICQIESSQYFYVLSAYVCFTDNIFEYKLIFSKWITFPIFILTYSCYRRIQHGERRKQCGHRKEQSAAEAWKGWLGG